MMTVRLGTPEVLSNYCPTRCLIQSQFALSYQQLHSDNCIRFGASRRSLPKPIQEGRGVECDVQPV